MSKAKLNFDSYAQVKWCKEHTGAGAVKKKKGIRNVSEKKYLLVPYKQVLF